MDIKSGFSNYAKVSGVSNLDINKIKESISIIETSGIDYEFRTTLIKEYHEEQNIRLIAEWIKGAKNTSCKSLNQVIVALR